MERKITALSYVPQQSLPARPTPPTPSTPVTPTPVANAAAAEGDFIAGAPLSYKEFLSEANVCCEGKVMYLYLLRAQEAGKLEDVSSKRLAAHMHLGIGKVGLTIREMERAGWAGRVKRGAFGTTYLVRRAGWRVVE